MGHICPIYDNGHLSSIRRALTTPHKEPTIVVVSWHSFYSTGASLYRCSEKDFDLRPDPHACQEATLSKTLSEGL